MRRKKENRGAAVGRLTSRLGGVVQVRLRVFDDGECSCRKAGRGVLGACYRLAHRRTWRLDSKAEVEKGGRRWLTGWARGGSARCRGEAT